jgi:hypothetical protein
VSDKLYTYIPENYLFEMKDGFSSHRYRDKHDHLISDPPLALKDEQPVVELLDAIDELEKKTRPSLGGDAEGKDMAASIALSYAAQLVSYVAGWAIDHQLGLARAGLRFVPIVSKEFETNPEYLARRAAVDTHDHERNGSNRMPLTPVLARAVVLNMLLPMVEYLRIPYQIVEAIEALDFGETLPILEKVHTTKRTGLVEYRAKLTAIAFIDYEKEKGVSKRVSKEVVMEEFAVTNDAVKDWKTELISALGIFEVDRTLAGARASGRLFFASRKQHQVARDFYEDRYGSPALLRAARQYKSRSRKGDRKSPSKRV